MNISSFKSRCESMEFTFISLSGLLASGERFPNSNLIFNNSIIIRPSCMLVVRNDDDDDDDNKNSWVATLACSPGMGVGVLECWGVCTKGFKHTNQLNPAHMQTFRHQTNNRGKYTYSWNRICQDLINHRVKFR